MRSHHRRIRTGAAFALAVTAMLHPVRANATDAVAADILARFTPPNGEHDPLLAALAAGRITTDVPPLRPGQVVPDAVTYGYVIRGTDLDGFDVTNTVEGRAEIAAYVLRLHARGESVPSGFTVFSLPDVKRDGIADDVGVDPLHGDVDPGDIGSLPIDTAPVDDLTEGDGPLSSALVVPACAPRPSLVGAVLDRNGIVVKTTVAVTPGIGNASVPCDVPQPSRMVSNAQDPTDDSDAWTPTNGYCWPRKQNNTAWFDPCYWFYHRTNDGIPDRDTYALAQWGTGKSKSIWYLDSLEVQSWRQKGTPDQDWMDWSPRSDQDAGNCRSTAVGVNVAAAYIEKSATLCDKWDIHKGAEPADFANRWHGDAHRSERETAMFIATSVPNGYTPHDLVEYDYYAYK